MKQYAELLAELEYLSDAQYASFHRRLLKNDNIKVIGVRVPQLRKIAKNYITEIDALMSFPDDYYEVTFIKLTAVSRLQYEQFIKYVDSCVNLIDNWATCDCFTPNCIKMHRQEFLPFIRKFAERDAEFSQRFALTTLLHYYVDDEYAETIFSLVERCNTQYYYVYMAAAWLIAETLVKMYDKGKSFLYENSLDKKTHNKAIQKACESFRLSNDQKNYLKGMKR